MKTYFKLLIFLSVLLLIASGCKKDSSISPTIPEITNINGNWSGKTSQNENVSFTVESNVVKAFKIKVRTPGFTQETQISGGIFTVINDSFIFSSYSNMATLYITGNFLSNTSSEGTFQLSSTEGTWSATK